MRTIAQLRDDIASLLSVREYLTDQYQRGNLTLAQANAAGQMLVDGHWDGTDVLDCWGCIDHTKTGNTYTATLVGPRGGTWERWQVVFGPGTGVHAVLLGEVP